MEHGKVYLVGAGPGDPALITVKGLDCLRQADVIIYDRLVDDRLLNETRPDAETIYVGKTSKHHTKRQEEINQLLVKKAREGKVVVRLKGGDPFVLGRGGEEAEALGANHIPFEVVPGISSATAVPAYAGIPVTHRHFSSSLAIIAGHEHPYKGLSSIAWDKISTGADTLVFLMGMENLGYIVERLIQNGRPPSTPVAVICNGTTLKQQTVVGTLEDIVARTKQEGFQPPAVIVVGEVVCLRERLRWFDNHPLFGKRILVTRARNQASQLSRLLLERGALPVEMPVIEIQPPATFDELDQAILNLDSYHWIIFTSVNGVKAFCHRLYALNLDAQWLQNIRIGAIGPATANALQEAGLHADYLPQAYTSESLLDGLGRSQDIAGCRVLLPRSNIADKELAQGITWLGAEVHEIIAYRTIPATETSSREKQMLLAGEIDIIIFTSSSTVINLLTVLTNGRQLINKALVACIGPKTAATAANAGLRVDIVAQKHTVPGLIEAIEQHLQRKEKKNEQFSGTTFASFAPE